MRTIAEEYRIISSGAGWIDRRLRGRIRFDGADTAAFLQALVTNDVAALTPGHGLYAAYLTPQGRMIADLEIYHRGDAMLADVAPGLAAPLVRRFDDLVFAEDVRVSDVSDESSETVVVGRDAAAAAARVTGVSEAALADLAELAHVPYEDGFVARAGDARLPSFKIIVAGPAERVQARLHDAGIEATSAALADFLRIEAGRPLFGVDMNEDTIPLEAGLLDRAISTTKGCYVGQEIVIRILHRGGGRVAKRLATLECPAAVPASGTRLFGGEQEVGRVTSAAIAPDGSRTIGLGYVARDAAEIGARLRVGAVDGGEAVITGFAR